MLSDTLSDSLSDRLSDSLTPPLSVRPVSTATTRRNQFNGFPVILRRVVVDPRSSSESAVSPREEVAHKVGRSAARRDADLAILIEEAPELRKVRPNGESERPLLPLEAPVGVGRPRPE